MFYYTIQEFFCPAEQRPSRVFHAVLVSGTICYIFVVFNCINNPYIMRVPFMKNLNQLRRITLSALFLLTASGVVAGAPFASISKAKHIYGPELTPEDLKGKVVFLEYWGINCPPCRASFPHLVELQKKFAKNEKFTILASHVQNFSGAVKPFLMKNKVNFPVYQFFRSPQAPTKGFIPYAALFDYTGKLIATGSPTSLYSRVKKLVDATPAPIIGTVEVKYCKKEAASLASGRSLASTIIALRKLAAAGGDKGGEAKQLADNAEAYLNLKKEQLAVMADASPSRALNELAEFAKKVKGLEMEKDVSAKLAELRKDNSLKAFMRLRPQWDKLNEKLSKRDSSSVKKAIEALKKKIQKIIDDPGTTPAVAAEAKALIGG